MEEEYRYDQLGELLVQVKDGQVPFEDLYGVLHAFGEHQFLEARPVVEEHLAHPDEDIRYIALNVLVLHWNLEEHRSTCEHALFADSSSDNRRLAATCLGSLLWDTHDEKALRMLLAVFHNAAENRLVVESAYSAILYVLGVPPPQHPGAGCLTPDTVDWDRLRELEQQLYG